jgi:hypothetical protein
MNAELDDFTPHESQGTQLLAKELLPQIKQGIAKTRAEYYADGLQADAIYPVLRIEVQRRYWPLSLLFAPHARGLRLDPKAFAFILRKAGLLHYRLAPIANGGKITAYWVARWNPDAHAVQAKAPELVEKPSTSTSLPEEPSPLTG